MIHVGCCGFCLRQAEYFRRFRLLEVQKTFYKPPKPETASRWRTSAPDDFVFAVKAWQLITHAPSSPTYRKAKLTLSGPRENYGGFRVTPEVLEAWRVTRRIAGILRAPIVIFQTPSSFGPEPENVENIRRFFHTIERGGLALGWESRGRWPEGLLRDLTGELDLLDVVDPFVRLPVTEGTAYFRLHGRRGYRYRFTDDDLAQLAEWCGSYRESYCLFNNVFMAEDAVRFLGIISEFRSESKPESASGSPHGLI